MTASGLGGQGNAMSGLGDLAKQIGQMIGQLMSGAGSGSSGSSGSSSTETCPTGYTGTYPDCTLSSTTTTCPTGYSGTYPDCTLTTTCPTGYTGTYPNCTASTTCPTGYSGTYPNCTANPTCPTGYTGTYPNCTPNLTGQCPAGYSGTFPNCTVTNSNNGITTADGTVNGGGTAQNNNVTNATTNYNSVTGVAGGSQTANNPNNAGNSAGGTTSPDSMLNSDTLMTANLTGTFQVPTNGQALSVQDSGPNQLSQGITGGIDLTGTGATFIANNIQANTETSTLFGGDGILGAVNGLIGSWCQSRPWASGIISSIIPPTFFDGLCSKAGFSATAAASAGQTAAAQPTAAVSTSDTAPAQPQTVLRTVLTQSPVQQQSKTPTVSQVVDTPSVYIPPRVDIWAVPATVPLGSRTEIFWNTENVTNCVETSPDGSFRQTSLSGGAATVPLTQTTTFTISCFDSQQNPATDYVTVNIGG